MKVRLVVSRESNRLVVISSEFFGVTYRSPMDALSFSDAPVRSFFFPSVSSPENA